MKIIGMIPARLGSTRLQQKVLAMIAGKPMIVRVWERVVQAKELDDVIVACDDQKIADCVTAAGGKAMLTSVDHPNGSCRVAEVASRVNADIFINIQGDEPTIHPESIDLLAKAFRKEPIIVATLAVRRHDAEEYANPNVVKVVCSAQGNALYFSRSPLPFYRDTTAGTPTFLKHIGIYGYQKDFLLKYVTWNSSPLESAEKLEQLRILEQGISLRVIETAHDSRGVDTAQDLKWVESKIQSMTELAR